MKILITGGAGFIGHHLALALVAEGHEVVIVDNLDSYYDPTLKAARLARLPKSVEVHKLDIVDFDALEKLFQEHSFDRVAHLAACAGVRYSVENPFVFADTNYRGTMNVFELAKRHKVPHTVYASSSSVYGNAEEVPCTEATPTDKSVSIYAATKKANEVLAHAYCDLFGMHLTGLRFFTVYGPWGRPDMALFLFTDAIFHNQPVQLNNGGDMRRDFTYVDDIVQGFVKALEKPNGYQIYNLGHGTSVYLLDFVRLIEKKIGKKATIDEQPMQLGDVYESYADITKARTELGFDPKVSVEEGIDNFVDWYREYYKA